MILLLLLILLLLILLLRLLPGWLCLLLVGKTLCPLLKNAFNLPLFLVQFELLLLLLLVLLELPLSLCLLFQLPLSLLPATDLCLNPLPLLLLLLLLLGARCGLELRLPIVRCPRSSARHGAALIRSAPLFRCRLQVVGPHKLWRQHRRALHSPARDTCERPPHLCSPRRERRRVVIVIVIVIAATVGAGSGIKLFLATEPGFEGRVLGGGGGGSGGRWRGVVVCMV